MQLHVIEQCGRFGIKGDYKQGTLYTDLSLGVLCGWVYAYVWGILWLHRCIYIDKCIDLIGADFKYNLLFYVNIVFCVNI
jgi:hypothetical protein